MPASLTLERHINATPQKVFAAWTQPEKMSGWWGITGSKTLHAQADLRQGGRYAVGFRTPDGEEHNVGGVYREIVPNEKLVFTWAWRSTPERESLVTLTFEPDGAGTLLTLRHEKFFDERARDDHQAGWAASLDRLDAFAEGGPEHDAIRAVIAAREAAHFSKDAEALTALSVEDAVVFELPPPLMMRGSRERAIAGLQGWFQTWQGPIDWRLDSPKIAADATLAYAFGLSNMHGLKVGGEKIDQWYRTTLCFRNTADGWKIVHQHNSAPFAMDGSYRALVDLKP